jgi:hypothetical protein
MTVFSLTVKTKTIHEFSEKKPSKSTFADLKLVLISENSWLKYFVSLSSNFNALALMICV